MLHIQLDPQSGVPTYRQVMHQIKLYVVTGALPEGERLPSIRNLSRQLAVNPSTVVKVYNELQHEGIVEMHHGKGVFVKAVDHGLTRRARRDSLRPRVQRLIVEARQLGLSAEELSALVEETMNALKDQEKNA